VSGIAGATSLLEVDRERDEGVDHDQTSGWPHDLT
jgi:hypothetical protein